MKCQHREAVYWNPYNKVVQCHRCGIVFVPASKLLEEAANKVFNWYYIFGENNLAAREHLAHLGNVLKGLK